jgi:tyrosine-protein phosphatase SIW14
MLPPVALVVLAFQYFVHPLQSPHGDSPDWKRRMSNMMPQVVRYALSGLIAAVMIGGPLGYVLYKKSTSRNLRLVTDGVLYRSGQLSIAGLKQAIQNYGIRTVVTLRTAREPGDEHPALEEEAFCLKEEINYHRIHVKGWIKENGKAPIDESVQQFLDIMKDPANYPVLVHCFAGKHRTGAFCAIYRMEFEDWSNERALDEMEANGYDTIDNHEDLKAYLSQYQPLLAKHK